MTLKRTQIRAYTVARLLNQTLATDRVKDTLVLPIFRCPFINVYTEREQLEQMASDGPPEYWLSCHLMIQAVVDVNNNYATVLDNLCEAITRRLDWTLGALVQRAEYQGTEEDFAIEGEKTLSVATLTYKCHWIQAHPATIGVEALETLKTVTLDIDRPAGGVVELPLTVQDLDTIA